MKIFFFQLIFFISFSLYSQIERIEPPNWWIGFKDNTFQLLVKGEGIGRTNPEINHPGIQIFKITKPDSPNYLFIDIRIDSLAIPGKFNISFKADKNKTITYEYEIKERLNKLDQFKGFDVSDVIYLITPDRFSNGDISNDSFEFLKEKTINRKEDYARHGGDLKGISKKIDYLSEMGFTAIWTNPFLINNMDKYSYHGYSVTDHYQVDPRFGSLKELVDLSEKLNKKGIKLIMDQVANHCGLEHWWMSDLPFKDWINYQDEFEKKPTSIEKMRSSNIYNQDSINKYFINTNHRRTINQDLYASKNDRDKMIKGWFVSSMPDLNHSNEFMSRFIIQNSIWWIETLSLGGIRQDTYPYGNKIFMSKWAGEIMNEYPKFTIVGEEWSYNPMLVNYWQNGSKNKDGYVSNLNSTMDFPMQRNILEAINEEESWNSGLVKIYEGLSNDFYYSNPNKMMIFLDNHDINRVFTEFNHDLIKTKMALGYILTLPRIPQILYGTEILMDNSKNPGSHGLIRKDFPGGWQEDEINGFSGHGLTDDQKEMKSFLRKLLLFRKKSSIIHNGKTIHFSPESGVYVMFRIYENETLMLILNKNIKPYNLDLQKYNEIDLQGKRLYDVFTEKYFIWNQDLYLIKKGVYIYTTSK